MRAAIELALRSARADEVPVGAIVVHRGEVIGRGANRQIRNGDPTAHAEIVALRAAARSLGTYRLRDATLYSTLEPCAMCAGALVAARVARLVFGSRDLRFGAVRSKFRLADSELLNHRLEISEGILAGECLAPLRAFFAARRLRGEPGSAENAPQIAGSH
jgi:tRNA(adenine34) deaminase